MLAYRDQENLVHSHQTTAAGKPLNQGIKTLQPKTPGNKAPKTPFRVTLNDENKPHAFNGKNTGIDNQNGLQTSRKGGQAGKNEFNTPIVPRSRAPLGMKTTNAKGVAFQTPAPAQQVPRQQKTNKRQSSARKSIKSKITIAPSEPVEVDILAAENDEELPEMEYAPPPPIELPDPPEVFEYDQTFPQFQGANMCRGWNEIYGEPRDEDGEPFRLKRYEEACARHDSEVDRKIKESLMDLPDIEAELDRQVDAMMARGQKKIKSPQTSVDTIKARHAAQVLSQPSALSRAMKPTASYTQKTKSKSRFPILGSKEVSEKVNASSTRHAAARAVSKNTIGFPPARATPSIIPANEPVNFEQRTKQDLNQLDVDPIRFVELYGEPPAGSDMWLRLQQERNMLRRLDGCYDIAGDLLNMSLFPIEQEDEEDFQLPMPS